ncbi:MAG: glycosyltransferase family 2 protein [Actinomycetes bacterium]|nr:glycosyltransferase family 2 protein [Acidimicrobiia bacterium]
MSSTPRVSVIIPARNAAETIADAVRSALDQEMVDEVVVAAADPATRSAIEGIADPRVKVVGNPEGTTPAALNRALRHSSGDVVVRCDAHSVLPPGYVARAVALLEETGAANVGGRQVPRGTSPFERAVAMAMVSPLGAGDARYRLGGPPGPTDTVYLGVFRRSELEAVGGFDETLERNQDYELNWRLRQKGGVVWFDPGLAVEYRPRSTPRALWRQYFDYGYWKRIVLRRHPESLRWRQLAAPALVVGLGVSAALAVFDWRKGSALPGVYVAATAGAGLVDLVRGRDPAALLEPVALWVMHIAWGSGFIAGLLSGRR